MEIRWGTTAAGAATLTPDLAHCGSVQSAVAARNLGARAGPHMADRHYSLMRSSPKMSVASASSPNSSLFASRDMPMRRSRSSRARNAACTELRRKRKPSFTVSIKKGNVIAAAVACRRCSRLMIGGGHGLLDLGRGLGLGMGMGMGKCRSFSGPNGALNFNVVQALSSDKGEGGRGHDQSQRAHASSDSSSSEPSSSSSPVPSSSSSSPSSTTTSDPTTTTTTTSSTSPKNQLIKFFSPVLSIGTSLWRQLVLLPMSNFGFGKSSIWEGGVGLFVMSGAVLLAILLTWVSGVKYRSKNRRYEAVIEFARAQGITVGTPVRIRGVDVGSVVGMRPSLERIDVVVQLADLGIVIPRNALVEVNQSGLISETLIDVTPREPLPKPTLGPLDEGCSEEGLIVCDKERIRGEQGVSLDELVGVCTKLARQVGDVGVQNVYVMAKRVAAAIDDAKPLLAKVEVLAGDVEPLLKELKDGVLLKDLEHLTKVVAEAGDDLRNWNKQVLTDENTELLRQSVATLTKTLTHIENISQDVSGVTGDANTKKNLRQLIESLSRLVMD